MEGNAPESERVAVVVHSGDMDKLYSALIIGTGGGRDILTARLLGVEKIRAVEINPLIVDIARNRYREFSGDPYGLPGVEVSIRDGRSYAAESREQFDVVQLAAVDTFAASGAGAMARAGQAEPVPAYHRPS